jgi:hypothetical protein
MKKIAKLLKADFNESSDLASIAAMLAGKGRGRDTLLAHITPREAEILKAAGGSGTTNPETGLLEFDDSSFVMDFGYGQPGDVSTDQGFNAEAGQTYQVEPPPTGDVSPVSIPQTRAETSQAQDIMFAGPTAGVPQGQALPTGEGVAFSPTGQPYTPRDLARIATDRAPVEQPIAPTAAPAPDKSFLDKISSQDMIRLGLAGGLGLYGASQAKKAAGQAQAASAEQKALAQPYQQKGQELIRAAESGELTPTGQQSLQATQARIAQGVEARGGVGAQQAAAQVEAFRQQLLTQQYNYGLQIAQVGDSIALGAIKTGLQADNAVQQATGQFYTSLASIASGLPLAERRTA